MGRGGQLHEPCSAAPDSFLAKIQSDDDVSRDPEVWDLIVVGAGVAGCSLAHTQGQAGRRVLLLERDLSTPDRIVGELLQPGGYRILERLGLADCCSGIDAQKVFGYCMFKDGSQAKIEYPREGSLAEVAGRSFHNGWFVHRLREAASACPNVTLRQGTAKRLLNGAGHAWEDGDAVAGVCYFRTPRGCDGAVPRKEASAKAHLTIVCDGMYSALRGNLSEPDIQHPSHFVGLLLRGAGLPWPNYGHVVLAKPSPILFYPISSTEVRCLVDVPGEKLPHDMAQYLEHVVVPEIPEQLRPAFREAVAAGSWRSMRNKSMPARPLHRPGALLLGDAFNMRHPLTGGGMTVALSDAALLSDMLQPLPNFADQLATAHETAAFYTKRKPLSATINTLANALYRVFCYTGDKAHEEMRQACFDYLRLGGMYSSGPISLLSGMNPRPSILVMHFFMVAIFGVGRLLRPRPTFRGIWLGVLLLWGAAAIILPIIRAEGIRAVFLPWSMPRQRLAASNLLRDSAGCHQAAAGGLAAAAGKDADAVQDGPNPLQVSAI